MRELVPVAPAVLVWARRSALASVAEAAERTGQPATVIRDWEAGAAQPTFSQLENLANEYGCSYNVLLLPKPPETPQPPADFRAPSGEHEPLSRATRKELRRARYLQELMAQVSALPPVALPAVRRAEDPAAVVRRALEVTVAQQVRWRDANEAFRGWRAALNRIGVLVLQYSLPIEELLGLSLTAAGGGPPVIVVNQTDFPNSRVFTLLHELGHLLLEHEGGICDPWRRGLGPSALSVEVRCNRFAGAVLVPSDHVRGQPEAQLAAAEESDEEAVRLLWTLGRRYRVSAQVMWYRLHDLGLVPDERFRSLWPQLRSPARIKRAQTEDERGGIARWQRATWSYGPEVLGGLLGAMDRGAVGAATLMRALNLGTGDLARLQGETGR
jgi:Zn-dependent peptidase ImmA (M78 family)